MKIVLANKPKYVERIQSLLERALGSSELLLSPNMAWFLFQDKGKYVGAAYAYQISSVRTYVNVVFAPESTHHKDRKQAGTDLIDYLRKTLREPAKLETTVPTSDATKRRYFAQLGFKREGIARSSVVVDGEAADQHYLGYVL